MSGNNVPRSPITDHRSPITDHRLLIAFAFAIAAFSWIGCSPSTGSDSYSPATLALSGTSIGVHDQQSGVVQMTRSRELSIFAYLASTLGIPSGSEPLETAGDQSKLRIKMLSSLDHTPFNPTASKGILHFIAEYNRLSSLFGRIHRQIP